MFRKLITRQMHNPSEIRTFFDQCARSYHEQHGEADRLLHYRICLIKQKVRFHPHDVVLDLGCGNGHHLFALAGKFRRGVGIDLSPEMIAVARESLRTSPWQTSLSFRVEDAESLSGIASASFDKVLCIGSLEHMPNKSAVLASVQRVLKPQGCFLCLTPNGACLWYRHLAPLLRLETKHLSTDKFLGPEAMERLLSDAGFARIETDYWSFIPKGDVPPALGAWLQVLDHAGTRLGIGWWRGGLRACAWK